MAASKFYLFQDVADMLNMSLPTLERAVIAGDVPPAVKVAGRRMFARDTIDKWVDRKSGKIQFGDVNDVAEIIGISAADVGEFIKMGRLPAPFATVAGKDLFRLSEVDAARPGFFAALDKGTQPREAV